MAYIPLPSQKYVLTHFFQKMHSIKGAIPSNVTFFTHLSEQKTIPTEIEKPASSTSMLVTKIGQVGDKLGRIVFVSDIMLAVNLPMRLLRFSWSWNI